VTTLRDAIMTLAEHHIGDGDELGEAARTIAGVIRRDRALEGADSGFVFDAPSTCYVGPPAALVTMVLDGFTLGRMPVKADQMEIIAEGFKAKAAQLRLEWQNRPPEGT
jgi:hypothetical protein